MTEDLNHLTPEGCAVFFFIVTAATIWAVIAIRQRISGMTPIEWREGVSELLGKYLWGALAIGLLILIVWGFRTHPLFTLLGCIPLIGYIKKHW
jgi:hypothetical protein